MDSGLAAFLGISILVIVTPGQDTALTIRNTLLGGRQAGSFTAVGVASGQLAWTLAATLGITALLIASEPAFAAIRLIGAGYLVFLGLATLRSALRGTDHPARAPDSAGSTHRPTRAFRQGLLSNLANPKMAIFFSSLLPQFAPAGDGAFVAMLGLGITFCLMTLAWLVAYAWIVSRAGAFLRRSRVRRSLDAITGTVLVAFGVRIAAEPA